MTITTSPRSRPILFSAPMVRAILEGRKTQTRRIIKPQPDQMIFRPCMNTENHFRKFTYPDERTNEWLCPYGQPGDHLWVREKMHMECDGGWYYSADREDVETAAENEEAMRAWLEKRNSPRQFACPSIHMPRWASRLTLEITSIRVERVQDITEDDAWAEGCARGAPDGGGGHFPADVLHPGGTIESWDSPVDWFADLWDSINGEDSFDANPWVWVVGFKRITGGVA